MTGKEFIVLAKKLAEEVGAAECRSAVSRAYYGAFHAALALLARTGVLLPPAPECIRRSDFACYSRESFRESRLVKNSSRYDVIEILLIMICVSAVVKLPNLRGGRCGLPWKS